MWSATHGQVRFLCNMKCFSLYLLQLGVLCCVLCLLHMFSEHQPHGTVQSGGCGRYNHTSSLLPLFRASFCVPQCHKFELPNNSDHFFLKHTTPDTGPDDSTHLKEVHYQYEGPGPAEPPKLEGTGAVVRGACSTRRRPAQPSVRIIVVPHAGLSN